MGGVAVRERVHDIPVDLLGFEIRVGFVSHDLLRFCLHRGRDNDIFAGCSVLQVLWACRIVGLHLCRVDNKTLVVLDEPEGGGDVQERSINVRQGDFEVGKPEIGAGAGLGFDVMRRLTERIVTLVWEPVSMGSGNQSRSMPFCGSWSRGTESTSVPTQATGSPYGPALAFTAAKA